MPTLYLLCDYWEPSLSRATHEARRIKNHTLHVTHIDSGELDAKLGSLCEESGKNDLILIAILHLSGEQLEKVADLLKTLPPEKTSTIKFCYSKYNPGLGCLIKNKRVSFELNHYESPRCSPTSDHEDRSIVTLEERRWIQYQLMRALIGGEKPKEVFEKVIHTLLENNLSHRQKKLAQNFYESGEPDMAGGNFAAERERNPNAIDRLRNRTVQVGRTSLNTLIIGETGTGKESIAWYLHDFSIRNTQPFLALNCAFFEGGRLESELFGHEQGAFTDAKKAKKGLVEEANTGTLFLDELPEMSPRVQAKLLRFLQDGSYTRMGGTQSFYADVRIISAAQPERMVSLRPDLYHRIADVELHTTPLRFLKKRDIVNIGCNLAYRLMWRTVLDKEGESVLTPDRIRDIWSQLSLPQNAECLAGYHWPGNMRELSSLIKRYVLLDDDIFQELCMKADLCQSSAGGTLKCLDETWRKFNQTIPDLEALNNLNVKLNDLNGAFIRNLILNLGGPEKVQPTKLAKILDCSYNTLKKYL